MSPAVAILGGTESGVGRVRCDVAERVAVMSADSSVGLEDSTSVLRPPPKPLEPEVLTLLPPHVVVLCSPNFRCGLTPISDPGCPQLKNYYSPIWIAMRWYKARAFMRHHKTPGAASAPTGARECKIHR